MKKKIKSLLIAALVIITLLAFVRVVEGIAYEERLIQLEVLTAYENVGDN